MLEYTLASCYPSNRLSLIEDLERAQRQTAPTLYNWIVEFLRRQGPAGGEERDAVEQVLESLAPLTLQPEHTANPLPWHPGATSLPAA